MGGVSGQKLPWSSHTAVCSSPRVLACSWSFPNWACFIVKEAMRSKGLGQKATTEKSKNPLRNVWGGVCMAHSTTHLLFENQLHLCNCERRHPKMWLVTADVLVCFSQTREPTSFLGIPHFPLLVAVPSWRRILCGASAKEPRRT